MNRYKNMLSSELRPFLLLYDIIILVFWARDKYVPYFIIARGVKSTVISLKLILFWFSADLI